MTLSRTLMPILIALLSAVALPAHAEGPYPWHRHNPAEQSIADRILPPEGYVRVDVERGSFGAWLRGLPLKPGRQKVYLYSGRAKANQSAQYAVIDIDTGSRDLQQCADAVMRLRAEYLYSSNQRQGISFHFTSGDLARYSDWAKGLRPAVKGNKVSWALKAKERDDYPSFRAYLDTVFTYAGSHSLSRELRAVQSLGDIEVGDVLIQGGFPGHAVLVVDVARDNKSGKKAFLLAQSYMPAQDIHILVNPMDTRMSPWYSEEFQGPLYTPEWTFQRTDLKRFGGLPSR